MNHVQDLLPDYMLGELSQEEQSQVETHLISCQDCLQSLRQIQATQVNLVESLGEQEAPNSWAKISSKLPSHKRSKPNWQIWAMAASFLLAASSFWWGLNTQLSLRQAQLEQTKVASWLQREDLVNRSIEALNGESVGNVLLLDDGRALFVLKESPGANKNYQAWGQRDGELFSLTVSNRSTFEVNYEGYEAVGVSLEPRGGSPQPTQPLGGVPTNS